MGDFGASAERSTKSDLVGIAPLTAKAITRRQTTGTEVLKEATHEESFALKNEEAAVVENDYYLDVRASKVTQK